MLFPTPDGLCIDVVIHQGLQEGSSLLVSVLLFMSWNPSLGRIPLINYFTT